MMHVVDTSKFVMSIRKILNIKHFQKKLFILKLIWINIKQTGSCQKYLVYH